MRLLLNVIWFVFAGVWMAIGYAFAALIMFILIITIPFGVAALRIGIFALWPFGRTVVRRADAGAGSAIGNAGWDGDSTARGPWTVNVVTVDPGGFRGTLRGTFGPTLEDREKTTELAALERANVALNAGFFVFDPTAGAEGDPAGAGVYRGRLQCA